MLNELNDFLDLEKRLSAVSSIIQTEQIKKNTWEVERTRLLLSVEEKKQLSLILLQVVELFKQLGGGREQEILTKIEAFISYGLGVVFGLNYSFLSEMRLDGRDLKIDFSIQTDDLRSDVVGAKGGGLAEVVSILLQLFFVFINKQLSRLVILDAALIHLSERYWKNMSQLLKEIVDKTDIQIVLLVHSGDYGCFADVLYEFFQSEGKTEVRRVK